MKLSAKEREKLRLKFGGRCAYCGCELPEKGWHADHVDPVYREWWKKGQTKTCFEVVDDTLRTWEEKQSSRMLRPENDIESNMFPSCRACNIDKGVNTLEGWRVWLNERIIHGLRRNSSTFRHAERFGRVTINTDPLVFWFERYQQSKENVA